MVQRRVLRITLAATRFGRSVCKMTVRGACVGESVSRISAYLSFRTAPACHLNARRHCLATFHCSSAHAQPPPLLLSLPYPHVRYLRSRPTIVPSAQALHNTSLVSWLINARRRVRCVISLLMLTRNHPARSSAPPPLPHHPTHNIHLHTVHPSLARTLHRSLRRGGTLRAACVSTSSLSRRSFT